MDEIAKCKAAGQRLYKAEKDRRFLVGVDVSIKDNKPAIHMLVQRVEDWMGLPIVFDGYAVDAEVVDVLKNKKELP